MKTGTLYWITGLAGAGKTTIGKMLFKHLKKKMDNVVFLDGDELRNLFGQDFSHGLEDRKKLAWLYAKISKLLTSQNINVVCSTISMFHEVRKWNRKNNKNYFEIYIKVSMQVLKKRDQKGLYTSSVSGKINNVIGIDFDFEEPNNPDIILNNNGEYSPCELFKILIEKIGMAGVGLKNQI